MKYFYWNNPPSQCIYFLFWEILGVEDSRIFLFCKGFESSDQLCERFCNIISRKIQCGDTNYKFTCADNVSFEISDDIEQNKHGLCCEIDMKLDLTWAYKLVNNYWQRVMMVQMRMIPITNLTSQMNP